MPYIMNSESQTHLSVIMFSDIVGYSKMMQENEDLTMQLLSRHNQIVRDALKKHDGKEIKMMGDAFLVSFATVANAVRCAVEIQEQFAKYNESATEKEKILLRIGIHMGDIVVKDNDVFGDGVNIASRIEPLAEPGGICISQEVYNLVRHKLDLQVVSLGPKELKNIKDKIEIYEILVGSITADAHKAKMRKKNRRNWVYALAGVIVLTVGLLITIRIINKALAPLFRDNSFRYESLEIKKLTNSGDILTAALSPDGQYVVYSTRVSKGGNLYLKHIPSSSTTKLWQADSGNFYSVSVITFSPDANYIYFVYESNLCRIARLGGEPKIIRRGPILDFAISPDGKRLAVPKWPELVTMNEDGSNEKLIGPMHTDKYVFRGFLPGRPWSPDGRLIALKGYNEEGSGLIIHNLVDSTEIDLMNPLSSNIDNVSWVADGKSLLLTGKRTEGEKSQLWIVSYPQGEVRQITSDANGFRRLSASADCKSLLAIQSTSAKSLWVLPSEDEFKIQKVQTGEQELQGWMSWTADNRLLFVTGDSRENSLKAVHTDGSKPTTLYSDTIGLTMNLSTGTSLGVRTLTLSPQVSRDIRTFYFESFGLGGTKIWRVDLQKGSRQSIYHDTSYDKRGLGSMALSADDEWLYVIKNFGLLKVKNDGKQVDTNFAKLDVYDLRLSPDGVRLACSSINHKLHQFETIIVDVKSRKVLQVLPITSSVEWTLDSKGLCYIVTTNNVPNLWMQPLTGGKPKQITHFSSDFISHYGWSPDGKYLSVIRESRPSDLFLLTLRE
jgi:class 3 adenylate cyclase/Tol biopolymer transport system component